MPLKSKVNRNNNIDVKFLRGKKPCNLWKRRHVKIHRKEGHWALLENIMSTGRFLISRSHRILSFSGLKQSTTDSNKIPY